MPKRTTGLGLDVPLWMYEGDSYFYHDYFRPYRRLGAGELSEQPVPESAAQVISAPVTLSESATYPETLPAQTVLAPTAPAQNSDVIKILTAMLLIAGRLV